MSEVIEPQLDQGFAMGPFGKTFAVSRNDGIGFDIFIHNAQDGSEIVRLTKTGESGAVNADPDISPNGSWVAFSYAPPIHEANHDIYIVGTGGNELIQITDTPNIDERWPTWSPDSLMLAYAAMDNSAPAPNWDIFKMFSE